jgi:hypothetical protein
MGKRTLGIYVLVILLANTAFAQRTKKPKQIRSPQQELSYTDKNYIPDIKTVEFYNAEKEQSLPLIHLGTNELLELSFDDLRADIRSFYFTIEHCDVDWNKSNLSILEYSSGYGEERINNITSSRNTLQAYTQYQTQFPTSNTTPLISGNYLLKVYEDADQRRLIVTRRFYVAEEKAVIDGKITRPLEVKIRQSHQRIDLAINTKGLLVNNPNRDIKVMVMQNNRHDVQLWGNNPSSIRDSKFTYNQPSLFNFEGGQEFLLLDLRSFRLESSMMKRLSIDSINKVELIADDYLSNLVYKEIPDENGRFYIRNLDQQDQSANLTDYAEVTFTLHASQQEKEIYLLGGFNNFSRTEENKMHYDKELNAWKIKKTLKQGVYDYLYSSASSPSFYETKNTYQVLVYYRNPRLNRDEIIGFYELK